MSLDFIEYPDREMLYLALASTISGQLSQHLRTHETASLCLPGGSTPAQVFSSLSGAELDWPRVTVFLNDERWVDGDSERSNSRVLRSRLLVDKAAEANYIDLYTGDADPADAVPGLGARLSPHLPISVLVLGMGVDMHSASIFPGSSESLLALAPDAPVLMPITSLPGEARLTLTAPVLNGALNKHLLITGPEKREALERAQKLDPTEAPVRAFLGDITVHWAE